MSGHKTVNDYMPIARSLSSDGFVAKFSHPFLFGREVLEEEFHFSTSVTDAASAREEKDEPGDAEVLKIRHWLIAIRKPTGAPAADRVFLGRSESNDLCVPHRTVSKLHAYFVRDPIGATRWYVIDTGSSNGTRHNGVRLEPRAKTELFDGDSVCFGRCLFQWVAPRTLFDRLTVMAAASPRP